MRIGADELLLWYFEVAQNTSLFRFLRVLTLVRFRSF